MKEKQLIKLSKIKFYPTWPFMVTTRPKILIFGNVNFEGLQRRPGRSYGGYYFIIFYALVQYHYMGKGILKIG